MGVCKLFLDFPIVVYFSFLSVNEQYLSWLQASFLGNLGRVEVHDSHLRCHNHHVVLCDGISCRSQAVAVEHTSCEASVAEQ